MAKKIIPIVFSLVAIIFISLWQVAIFNSGSGIISKVSWPLLFLGFILMFWDFRRAWWWALGFGLILELFSFYPFGITLICFLAVVVLGNWLLKYFLTNRSLYSFVVLNFFLFISYNIFFGISLAITGISQTDSFFIFSGLFWLDLLLKLAINGILATILFLLFSSRQRRRSSFLSTN